MNERTGISVGVPSTLFFIPKDLKIEEGEFI